MQMQWIALLVPIHASHFPLLTLNRIKAWFQVLGLPWVFLLVESPQRKDSWEGLYYTTSWQGDYVINAPPSSNGSLPSDSSFYERKSIQKCRFSSTLWITIRPQKNWNLSSLGAIFQHHDVMYLSNLLQISSIPSESTEKLDFFRKFIKVLIALTISM